MMEVKKPTVEKVKPLRNTRKIPWAIPPLQHLFSSLIPVMVDRVVDDQAILFGV